MSGTPSRSTSPTAERNMAPSAVPVSSASMTNAGCRRQALVDVGAAGVPRPRARRADDQERSRAWPCEPATALPKRSCAALAGQRQKHVAVLAGVDVRAARAFAARAVARRADDDVGVAVAVDIADAGDVLPEVVGDLLGREASAERGRPCPNRCTPCRARRAGDHVGHAVVIRVAGALDARAELVARTPVDAPEERAGLASNRRRRGRPPRRRSPSSARRSRCRPRRRGRRRRRRAQSSRTDRWRPRHPTRESSSPVRRTAARNPRVPAAARGSADRLSSADEVRRRCRSASCRACAWPWPGRASRTPRSASCFSAYAVPRL